VSLSIPSVTGPYTSVNCTLSLLRSRLRKSPLLKDGQYERVDDADDRFVDYLGTIESIVTSSANNDSGMFETNLRDERFLPFEGAGFESSWKLELPSAFRQFDYNTISDVIFHVRYTARQGGAQLREKAVAYLEDLISEAKTSDLTLLFSLSHDFPSEWHQFLAGGGNFSATVKRNYFPYFTQNRNITINAIQLHAVQAKKIKLFAEESDPALLTKNLNDKNMAAFTISWEGDVLNSEHEAFVLIKYSLVALR
jgi:hypothetical protein